MNLPSKALAVALLAATASWFASPAGAAPLGTALSLQAADAGVQTVAWRGGGGRGFGGGWRGGGWRGGGWGGAAAGLAAGAILGGAVAASQPWYGYDYDYGPGYYSYGYDPGYYGYASPGYGTAPPDAVSYCQARFRSYDPASGTYLGFDGLRHPCP